MAESSTSQGSASIDWNTEDELEIDCISSSSLVSVIHGEAFHPGEGLEKASQEGHEYSNASCPDPERSFAGDFSDIDSYPGKDAETEESVRKDSKLSCLIDMGYSPEDALAAVDKYGIDLDVVELVEFLDAAQIEKEHMDETYPDEDLDSCSYLEESTCEDVKNDYTFSHLIDMGYRVEDITNAIDRCGFDTPLPELVEFISAAQITMEADAHMDKLDRDEQLRCSTLEGTYGFPVDKKRKFLRHQARKEDKKPRQFEKLRNAEDDGSLHLRNPMVGFGLPSASFRVVQRSLPEAARGLPYFYFENVALTPKGVWRKISSFLYEVEPEFVDSKYFCAAARKRGYIHNLLIDQRFPLRPIPPKTIFDALPCSGEWWPSWDRRTQFNCLLTCIGSAKLTERIKSALETSNGESSLSVQQYVVRQCKKWNLVWVGKNKVAPLEPDEMEALMGFPKNHTRGLSRIDRYKCLGNTFQVDTVAYHLSVLKKVFPNGINVLSLFSGIGGAEVALHRLGIRLNNVVSVEKSKVCQSVLQNWWEQTQQEGKIIHISDVRQVTNEKLSNWMSSFGGFDLVIGGSPCNNLSGENRVSRDGLKGEHSSLFYDYYRILDTVRTMTKRHSNR